MPAPRSLIWFIAAVCVVSVAAPGAWAKPVTTLGELADWDPNRPNDLPKALLQADPNNVDRAKLARDTLAVLPNMLTKMETVILNLTEERTRARLAELFASILPDVEKKRPAPPAAVHAFVINEIAAKLEAGGATIALSELESLVEAVEKGPAKEFVLSLKKQGAEIPLVEFMRLVEKSPGKVRDFFRPTVMGHLDHGHVGLIKGLFADESEDPWSIALPELVEHAKDQPQPVRDYVAGLPVWLAHHRIELAAPDVPIHQLLEMLASSRTAYGKMVARPLVTDKDLQAPTKVAYQLQEAYARSEQINQDLVGRDVVGVIAVATLLILLSGLRGYIKVLNIPNRRIVA